jgi:N6-L-threonylcarbamoyladenine synthase
MSKKFILGIETSCDDTCIGILEIDHNIPKILVNIKINQNNLHTPYGGVVPEIAARSHIHRLPFILQDALNMCDLKIKDISLIAYTKTPGLLVSLLIGENFAKGLSLQYNIPIIGVNHLKAHVLVNFLYQPLLFPFFGLIISGGHTEIWYFNSLDSYKILIKTADDAIGELFDKIGRIMELPFPAGAEIEKLAQTTQEIIILTMPKILSFSGLKTQCIKLIDAKICFATLCNSLQKIVTELLVKYIKLHKITEDIYIAIGGGVAANTYIKKELIKNFTHIYCPTQELCTDNGIMIAWCGYLEYFGYKF